MIDDPTHPIHVALRTYALTLSFSVGPSLVTQLALPLITKRRISSTQLRKFIRVLGREHSFVGFTAVITLAIGGGATIRHLLKTIDELPATDDSDIVYSSLWRKARVRVPRLNEQKKTFISYLVASIAGFLLLQSGRRRWRQIRRSKRLDGLNNDSSSTLDMTILLFVRAMDVLLQYGISGNRQFQPQEPTMHLSKTQHSHLLRDKGKVKKRKYLASRIDALIFWACSARIMWCFFYEPQKLPRTYVKWIGKLANLDHRLLRTLNLIRDGSWSYLQGSPENRSLLMSYAQELGLAKECGDPLSLPPYGGPTAKNVWHALGIKGRPDVGGLPCELVHGRVGQSFGLSSSCTANAFLRGLTAFVEAAALYLPVHVLPVLLTKPKHLLRPHHAFSTLMSILRSATFLSTFIASYWYAVCLTRTTILARLLPWISHDFWDGPYGCILAGTLVCGNSIWIENGRRRGEMALYVLPRALRTLLPGSWISKNSKGLSLIERFASVISLSILLTAAIHRPDTLRGLSRWTLAFIVNGPNTGFWKRRRQSPSIPPTPTIPDKNPDTNDTGMRSV